MIMVLKYLTPTKRNELRLLYSLHACGYLIHYLLPSRVRMYIIISDKHVIKNRTYNSAIKQSLPFNGAAKTLCNKHSLSTYGIVLS